MEWNDSRHFEHGHWECRVQGLDESKFELKCDHRCLSTEVFMERVEAVRSIGGREFHNLGRRLK